MNATKKANMYTKNKVIRDKKQVVLHDLSQKITDERAFYLFKAGLTLPEHALLELILEFSNRYGMNAAPSQAWLGKQVGYCRQTVNKKLSEWRELGFMDWIYRHRKTSIYKRIRFAQKLVLSLLVAAKSSAIPMERHHLIKKDLNNNSYINGAVKRPAAPGVRPQNGDFTAEEIAQQRERHRIRLLREAEERKKMSEEHVVARENSSSIQEAAAKNPQMAKWLSKLGIRT